MPRRGEQIEAEVLAGPDDLGLHLRVGVQLIPQPVFVRALDVPSVWHQEVPEEFVLAAIVRAAYPLYLYATYQQANLVKQAPRSTHQLQRMCRRHVPKLEGQAQGRRVQPVLAGDYEARNSNAIR